MTREDAKDGEERNQNRNEKQLASPHDLPELLKKLRAQTPARLLAGRSGAAYRTNTQLDLQR